MKLDPSDRLEAVARLARIAAALAEAGDQISVEFAADVQRWLRGEVRDLADAVGVRHGQSEMDVRTVIAILRRNEAVCEAYRHYRTGEALARALGRYRESGWRRDRVHADCPPRLAGRPERLLFAILKERDRSLSKRQILDIVREARGSNRTGDVATLASGDEGGPHE